jgi:hypothetical protein
MTASSRAESSARCRYGSLVKPSMRVTNRGDLVRDTRSGLATEHGGAKVDVNVELEICAGVSPMPYIRTVGFWTVKQTLENVLNRDSRNRVSSSRIGRRRQLAACGWGRLSRRREEQGTCKKRSAVQHAGTPDGGVGRGLSGPNTIQNGIDHVRSKNVVAVEWVLTDECPIKSRRSHTAIAAVGQHARLLSLERRLMPRRCMRLRYAAMALGYIYLVHPVHCVETTFSIHHIKDHHSLSAFLAQPICSIC